MIQPRVLFHLTKKMKIPILTDVSLRDGIQGASEEVYTLEKKKCIYSDIVYKYRPANIEIGSFVSPKVLPIMKDTPELFQFTKELDEEKGKESFVLVPNKTGLLKAMDTGFKNFSFITSVSNEFQLKNTKRDLEFKKAELSEMMELLSAVNRTKLYVSCITECPIQGPVDPDYIIHEILTSYGHQAFDEICLSDTLGTLKARDLEYIVDGLLRFGIAKNRLSLHLHVDSENEKEVKRILHACFDRDIIRFDVSTILEGGCSVTLTRCHMKPNLTYELFEKTFKEYNNNELYYG
jgi:hydroxymethylglutaryl-CoA lyase